MKQFNIEYLITVALLLTVVVKISNAQYIKLIDFDSSGDTIKGYSPVASLALSLDGTVLYGTAKYGGRNNKGTVFKINTDGTGFAKLVDFDGDGKGANPSGTLTLSETGTVLYGTAGGGTKGFGVIFKVNTDGSGFTKLVDVDMLQSGVDLGDLILSGNVLFGTAKFGGANDRGVIFKVNTDGTGFKKLLDFDGNDNGSNNKGSIPNGNLLLVDNVLYGTTNGGGTSGLGVVFKIDTAGVNFTKLHDCTGTNNDNAYPLGNLVLHDNVLYGEAEYGSSSNAGVIYKIKIDGTGFENLFVFDRVSYMGSFPCNLLSSRSILYGMTYFGGLNNKGTLYSINADGTGFITLIDFDSSIKGRYPQGGLTISVSGNVLYGMTPLGGANEGGVLFKYVLPATGVPERVGVRYKIYPNPLDNQLTIENETAIITRVDLVDVYGQVVKSVICNSANVSINTSDLSEGMYILKIYEATGNIISHKILRQTKENVF